MPYTNSTNRPTIIWGTVVDKLAHWIFLSVLVALFPIIFNFTVMTLTGRTPTLTGLLVDGELLLVAAGISAGAISDLFRSEPKFIKSRR
jgi:hypothetical protein